MMKIIRKVGKFIVPLLLSGILVTSCGSGEGKKDKGESSEKSENGLVIAENGSSDYCIVIPGNADSKIREGAVAFAQAVLKQSGAKIEIIDDYIKSESSGENGHEILIGKTNRAESSKAAEDLDYADYSVSVYGSKLVIVGGSGPALLCALDYAASLPEDGNFRISETYAHTVLGADLSDYWYVLYPVVATSSSKASSLSVSNSTDTVPQKLSCESRQITDFDPEWGYTHHARIGFFKGKIYAAWTATPRDEDTVDSRIMLSVSEDFDSWSSPKAIVENDPLTETSSGFFHVYGDTLYFYYNSVTYSQDLSEKVTDTSYYICTNDGVNWSQPKTFGLYTGSTAPQYSYGGRLFLCRGTSVLYTDDPSGESGWVRHSIDTSRVEEAYAAGARELCEGNFYQSRDGVIHMIMRADDGYLWQTESYDNGETWSGIYKTSFTDDNAMSYFGKLPDGRIYYIGNPYYTGYSLRSPLMLCISNDGYRFDEQYILKNECDYSMKMFGLAKSGYYGYPEAVVGDDGYVYIVYSKLKEVIEVTRFRISDIGNPDALSEIPQNDKGIFIDFTDQSARDLVSAIGNTSLSYDLTEQALKVSGASGFTLNDTGFLDGQTSTQEYPVIAVRIKKKNYTGKYCGLLYWKTDTSGSFYKFGSFRYANDEEYHTMIIDLSELYGYASSSSQTGSVKAFNGNWEEIQFCLGNSSDMNKDSSFYVKWIAVFPSVTDAMNYVMTN